MRHHLPHYHAPSPFIIVKKIHVINVRHKWATAFPTTMSHLLLSLLIELGRNGEFMEYCIVCAALAAWIRGTKFNWAEEVRSRIKEEIETHKLLRPLPLRSAGYIGLLCQNSFGPDITLTSRRKVAPFLSKPAGFVREEVVPQTTNLLPSPESPSFWRKL
jgi:hypothetical protein